MTEFRTVAGKPFMNYPVQLSVSIHRAKTGVNTGVALTGDALKSNRRK